MRSLTVASLVLLVVAAFAQNVDVIRTKADLESAIGLHSRLIVMVGSNSQSNSQAFHEYILKPVCRSMAGLKCVYAEISDAPEVANFYGFTQPASAPLVVGYLNHAETNRFTGINFFAWKEMINKLH